MNSVKSEFRRNFFRRKKDTSVFVYYYSIKPYLTTYEKIYPIAAFHTMSRYFKYSMHFYDLLCVLCIYNKKYVIYLNMINVSSPAYLAASMEVTSSLPIFKFYTMHTVYCQCCGSGPIFVGSGSVDPVLKIRTRIWNLPIF